MRALWDAVNASLWYVEGDTQKLVYMTASIQRDDKVDPKHNAYARYKAESQEGINRNEPSNAFQGGQDVCVS